MTPLVTGTLHRCNGSYREETGSPRGEGLPAIPAHRDPLPSVMPVGGSGEKQTNSRDDTMSAEPSDLDPKNYQHQILPHVSRTFALTIPQLPEPVSDTVANAYLLCRIADTIEDDPDLSTEHKSRAHEEFLSVLQGEVDADGFGRSVAGQLSAGVPEHERDLVRNTGRVVAFTHSLDPREQEVLSRCVAIMCRGMSRYQRNASVDGLRDLADVDRYCYYVAGVVGEMLTELFALHSGGVHEHRKEMLALAPSFGEGLQLTNILKDVWEDRRRGACWLPRDVFAAHGIDLSSVEPETAGPGFGRAMDHLVGVAHGHLRDAMRYTLMIPPADTGVRRFCLWAIGMAVLTLWRIHHRPLYTRGEQVKISRRLVRAVIVGSNLTARHDLLLKNLFRLVTFGLPRHAQPIDPELSDWKANRMMGCSARLASGTEMSNARTQ